MNKIEECKAFLDNEITKFQYCGYEPGDELTDEQIENLLDIYKYSRELLKLLENENSL